MLSWQNIWQNSQIATGIKQKLVNQEEALYVGISGIYLSFSNIWKSCNEAINIRPCNLRATLPERYFRFQWNYKQLWVEARNNMSNCKIYFPLHSETILRFWKHFHSMVLSLDRYYCKKIVSYNFGQSFWLRCLSAFKK